MCNMSGLEMLHSILASRQARLQLDVFKSNWQQHLLLKVVQTFNGSLKGLAIGSAEVN